MDNASFSGRLKALVVDDEPLTVELIKSILEEESCLDVTTSTSGAEALEKLEAEHFDILISDLVMPGADGFKLLERLREIDVSTLSIMVTALNDADSATRCLKLGAYDYITKPLKGEDLVHTVHRAAESLRLQRENEYLWKKVEGSWSFNQIIGKSPVMQEVFQMVRKAAQTNATVLVKGETGTGKELVARAIHNLSRRRDKNLVVIDCNALSKELLASELFGHAKGAFTGAVCSKRGLLETADGGSVFFDEIGDIDLALQPKLLRVLQRGEVRRVGETRAVDVNVRVVAATNQPLAELVKEGKFRADLFYRLHVIPIHLPPLRERAEDIPLLIQHFLARSAVELGAGPKHFAPEAVEAMMGYSWPGNVRELENEVARATALCPDEEIALKDLSPKLRKSPAAPRMLVSKQSLAEETYMKAKRLFVDTFQYHYIKAQLRKHQGNISRAADASGMERRTFQRLMKKFDFHGGKPSEVRPAERSEDNFQYFKSFFRVDDPLLSVARTE